jgi:2-iminobutanoate/2-iminopropanoate deaminase
MRRSTTGRANPARNRNAPPRAPFRVRHVCPPGLYDPKAFSHVVEVEGGRLVFISGQVPVDGERQLASKDFREQVRKVYDNLEIALRSVGAGFENVVKTTNYLTSIAQARDFREVREQHFAALKTRPASTTVVITALVDPEYLLEIEMIAAVPAG